MQTIVLEAMGVLTWTPLGLLYFLVESVKNSITLCENSAQTNSI